MCEVLDKLEKLTRQLPPIPPLSDFKNITEENTTYIFDSGISFSENLYHEDDIAIAKFFIPKDVEFSTHMHGTSAEWLIVLQGSLEVSVGGEKEILNRHDSLKIEAKKPHSAIALEGVIVIAITVPKDDGFPE